MVLDRDGTVIERECYLSDLGQVKLIPRAAEGLRRLRRMGLRLVLVTNQSGIGRGLFDEERLNLVHRRLLDLPDAEGIRLDGVYFCPYTASDGCRRRVQQASRDNPHLTTRLEKAAFLLLLRPIRLLGEERYGVGSEDSLREYQVVKGHCECSDYLRHGPGHPCKHRLALAMYLKLAGGPVQTITGGSQDS